MGSSRRGSGNASPSSQPKEARAATSTRPRARAGKSHIGPAAVGGVPRVIRLPTCAYTHILMSRLGVVSWPSQGGRPLRGHPDCNRMLTRTAVLIPALNEEEALPAVLAALPVGRLHSVVVADNGSAEALLAPCRAAGSPRTPAWPRRTGSSWCAVSTTSPRPAG